MSLVAIQTAIRAVLIGAEAVTDLVPADSILDRHARPAPDPSIVLGEDQMIEGDDLARQTARVVSTIHVWKREPSTVGVKDIASAMRRALHATRPAPQGYHCGDCRVTNMRFLRDPDGETSHGVVTVETLVKEIAAPAFVWSLDFSDPRNSGYVALL